jgi:tripartite-type tricarboxylate transporter receptor subunit TctC
MTPNRRSCLLAAIAALAAGHPSARAQSYPSRPIHIVVGFAAGSSTDVATRILAEKLGEILGQRVVVENKPGAASNIATESVARAPKDGYTLLMGTVANTINTGLRSGLSFDFGKDLVPIALVATVPNILVVHPSTGVATVAELVALAKAKPDQITYGSAGVGTSPHLSGELFAQMAGLKLVHVPYTGSAQAVTDLIAGRTSMMFSPASSVLPHVEAGSLKALASTEKSRTEIAPHLPTVAEAGLPGFDTSVWFGLMAPAGTPPEIIDRLEKAVAEALRSEQVASALKRQGIDPLPGGPEAFAKHTEAETRKWGDVIRQAGVKP